MVNSNKMLQTWQVGSQKQKVPCGRRRFTATCRMATAGAQIIHEAVQTGAFRIARSIPTSLHARQLLEEDCNVARPAYLAELLQRLRTYEIAAAKRGQYQVAVNSATQQAKLIGLDT